MFLLNGLCRRRLSLEQITTDVPVLAKYFLCIFSTFFFFFSRRKKDAALDPKCISCIKAVMNLNSLLDPYHTVYFPAIFCSFDKHQALKNKIFNI